MQIRLLLYIRLALVWCCLMAWFIPAFAQQPVVNDVTGLNPVPVLAIVKPQSTSEVVQALKQHTGKVSVGGGHYSMGGQTAAEHTLHLDMREFDSILFFDAQSKVITVQSGITWRKIQEFIDPHNLSVMIMQTYANFTVGGSLSVNVHGRYMGQGPIVLSVLAMQVALADGSLVRATPVENAELFYGVIGGYGGLGIITEVTLQLTDNERVKRHDVVMPIADYPAYFFSTIRSDSSQVFHNADIYPNGYRKIRAVSYTRTTDAVTVPHRLKPVQEKYAFNRFAFKVIAGSGFGKWLRQHMIDPLMNMGNPVEWRNYEASYDVMELEPRSRKKQTYVLQEYFVPVDSFGTFYPQLTSVLKKHRVNVINISIRHARKDPGTLLAWANREVFAFVIYYRQGTDDDSRQQVGEWTRELTESALLCGGTYYLPYQLHATPQQFERAYPNLPAYIALKKQVDPNYRFRNKLWDTYLKMEE